MFYHHLPIQTAILGYPYFRTRSCYRIVAYIYIYLFIYLFIYLYGCISHVISRCSIFPSFLFVLYPLYLFVSNVIPVITVGQFPSHIPQGNPHISLLLGGAVPVVSYKWMYSLYSLKDYIPTYEGYNPIVILITPTASPM